jgi:hypothetical protein
MPFGTIAAQLVHASGESSTGRLPDGTYALVLAAKDEADLLSIQGELLQLDVSHKLIREPDFPFNGESTAIGLVPMLRSSLPKFLRKLPLLRGER